MVKKKPANHMCSVGTVCATEGQEEHYSRTSSGNPN